MSEQRMNDVVFEKFPINIIMSLPAYHEAGYMIIDLLNETKRAREAEKDWEKSSDEDEKKYWELFNKANELEKENTELKENHARTNE